MRKLYIGVPPANATTEQKIDWIIASLRIIVESSHEIEPFEIADGFTITNLTEDRVLDADSTTTAELADVIGTFITDMKKRGAKRK